MSENKYDLAVIGSGPGGYIAALQAAHRGLKVACIDKNATVGGTCLNVGCIPSKTVLQATEHFSWLQNSSKEHGIEGEFSKFNFNQMMQRKQKVVSGLTSSVSSLFKKQKIDEIHGEATLISENSIEISANGSKNVIEAKYIILATGSEPISLPFLPIDEKQILSSTGALALEQVPKQLLVIGAGVIGVELASVYARLGSEVFIIEVVDRICPTLDLAISKAFLQILKKQKINFYLSHKVESAEKTGQAVTLKIKPMGENKEAFFLTGEKVLVSVGRRPYSAGLGLEKLGIETTKAGFVVVDDLFRTKVSNIFAIGDLIDGPMLAHRATSEAIACVENIVGYAHILNYLAVPNVIYTHPEVACVGFTEEEAQKAQLELVTATAAFRGNARARCSGEMDGFVKIIAEKNSQKILGLHILGAHASELIGMGALAIEAGMNLKQLAFAPYAHPTLSEAIKEAAMAALGLALHD